MKNKEYQSIIKMIEYINLANKYTDNITLKKFSDNDMILNATVFVISQIGELVKNLDNDFRKKYSEVDWGILKGLRNKIVHDYEGIQINLIWSIIKEDLPQLKNDLQKMIDNETT